MSSQYEIHNAYKLEFPLRFHLDRLTHNRCFKSHWHDNIEILFVEQGICKIVCEDVERCFEKGNVILFSPFCPHAIYSLTKECKYYVITASLPFCRDFGIPVNQPSFWISSESGSANACYDIIIKLMKTKPFAYMQEVKAVVLQLIIQLYRKHSREISEEFFYVKDDLVKRAIEYMNEHFAKRITIDDISNHIGVSKYYFCKKFKKVTGKTPVEHLNFIRCSNAKKLIQSGRYNVNESAKLSGFNNMSYFSKKYEQIFGKHPSEHRIKN